MHLHIRFTVCLILPSFCPSTLSYPSFLSLPIRPPSAPPPHLSLALGFCEPPTVITDICDCNRRRINEAELSWAAVLKVKVASFANHDEWFSFTSQNILVMNMTQNRQTEPPRRHQSESWKYSGFPPLFRTRLSETSEEYHCNDRKINGYVCPAATERRWAGGVLPCRWIQAEPHLDNLNLNPDSQGKWNNRRRTRAGLERGCTQSQTSL